MGADVDVLGPLRAERSRAGVFVDFDGTLAPIVLDPAAAVPVDGAVDALVGLMAAGFRVAVLSGRPVAFLSRHLPESLDVYGLYGLERRVDGVVGEDPEAERWRSVVDDVAARAALELPEGAEIEHKGLSLTLHTRRAPDLGPQVQAWATTAAEVTGLVERGAKQSVELHPPVDTDKGTVLERLLGGLRAGCFIGDDAGDLPAFDALDRFAASGGIAVRIAVVTEETVPLVVARADASVTAPAGVVDLLRTLL